MEDNKHVNDHEPFIGAYQIYITDTKEIKKLRLLFKS